MAAYRLGIMLKAFSDFVAGSLLICSGLVLVAGVLNELFGWNLALKIGGSRIEIPDDLVGLVFLCIILCLMALFFWSMTRLKEIWTKIQAHPFVTITAVVCVSGGLFLGIQQALGGALGFAVERGDEAKVLSLLQTETYPPEELGEYLYQALKNSHFEMAKGLLEKGADPNRISGEQATPLLTSAMIWFPRESIDILLDVKADPNLTDSLGRTSAICLLLYRKGNFPETDTRELAAIVQKLNEAGADFTIEATNGDTALALAEKLDSPEVMEAMK